jgi:hypothetical protein
LNAIIASTYNAGVLSPNLMDSMAWRTENGEIRNLNLNFD